MRDPSRPEQDGSVVAGRAPAPWRTQHPFEQVARLERRLGEPGDASSLVSYARSAELDRREQFPESEARLLNRLGLPEHYVPVKYGGRFGALAEAIELLRPISRRDLTLAIGHAKTFLGCSPVWVGGDEKQCRALAEAVRADAVVSLGLTEREHGSDLAAGTLTASRIGDGYRLDGEKWLINNARRAHYVTVLARTHGAGAREGIRGYSLFLLDRQALGSAYVPLPKERLHGIRGADISGFQLHGATVPGSALVGAEGTGIETLMMSLQVTRLLCTGLSLGAADHALDVTMTTLLETRRYGRPIAELPQTRRLFAELVADLYLLECLAWFAAASTGVSGDLSVTSPLAKHLVPHMVDGVLARCGSLIGTRSLLDGDRFADGSLQKVVRDHRLVGIFDGSSHVSLATVLGLVPLMRRGRSEASRAAALRGQGGAALDLHDIGLVPRGLPWVLAEFDDALAEIRQSAPGGPGLDGTLAAMSAAWAEVRAEVLTLPPSADQSLAAYTAAHRLGVCAAAASAAQLWLTHGMASSLERVGVDGLWLHGALSRALAMLGRVATDTSWREPLASAVLAGGPRTVAAVLEPWAEA